ncbi:MAG: 4-hydroxy-3-methylbut-2-enyl diphosphate reductase [Bacteroidota bacterium]
MIIDIDPTSGFCFGVTAAIRQAEELISSGEEVWAVGQMVHNEAEVKRLEKLGLKETSSNELANIQGKTVLFRAHGEPPSTYSEAAALNIRVVDATCPIVRKLQERIRKRYEEMDGTREQIVIFGKEGHPESIGLLGQTNGSAILVNSLKDLERVDPAKYTYLFSQTTMDPEAYNEIEQAIRERTVFAGGDPIQSNCTVCSHVKRRKPGLKLFAETHDVILFASGKASSNGKMLFGYCKQYNERSYWINGTEEIDPAWFRDCRSVGISGATSTPQWQMEEIKAYLQGLF